MQQRDERGRSEFDKPQSNSINQTTIEVICLDDKPRGARDEVICLDDQKYYDL
jgi:hypothetical protein